MTGFAIVQTRQNASVTVEDFVVSVETRRDATVMSFGLWTVTWAMIEA